MKPNPKISIITVVYNDVKHIEATILSVLNHNYANIEYILIDGASNDGTKELIEKYSNRITFWQSEPDKGIYDAMNKGLRAATGDYVWFLNSGDKIYQDQFLKSIFTGMKAPLPDVIYGDTMIISEDGSELGLRRLKPPDSLNWKSLQNGMLVCHQSYLVKRELTSSYNLKYHFAADFDWMINSLKKATSIFNSNQIVSSFLDGGISKKNIKKGLMERFGIMVKNYDFWGTLFRHFLIALRFFIFYSKNKRF